ncbi:lipopolysaccharide transport periplasmic protein LptA [uncultured Desulfuromusa sp.]|uniref:lipopolysaccharide transport periplasmic protein LptA n=1 Tax=uncultured Desulfuromusa sp. TaxID=219183 RepID=UPI002AA706E9|nr:lipopolysaccharide transport periplasmic protein LptA [uncultured Desulfuromusa sp.]
MTFRWFLFVFLTIVQCSVPQVFAAEVDGELDRNQPIVVTAQQLEVLQQQRQSVFTGEVVAKQGDMTLYAEKLIIIFQQDQDQVERMDAVGGVRVIQLDRVATAEKAVFRQAEETLVLVGSAEVTQGNNTVTGDEITVFLKENRTVIKSSEKNRVKATIVPEKSQEQQ